MSETLRDLTGCFDLVAREQPACDSVNEGTELVHLVDLMGVAAVVVVEAVVARWWIDTIERAQTAAEIDSDVPEDADAAVQVAAVVIAQAAANGTYWSIDVVMDFG